MKKTLLVVLTAICVNTIDAKQSAQDLLRDLVQLDSQESLNAESFEQEVKNFIDQDGDINEPIFVSPFDEEAVEFMTFLDPKKKQSLLSYALVFGGNSVYFVKTLLKYGANPLQDIYLKFGDDEKSYYKGTMFDSLLMTIIGDQEGIQRHISLEVMTNLLKKYDESRVKQIINFVFLRFYSLFVVFDEKSLKDTMSSLQESKSTLKKMLKTSKKDKNKSEFFILKTIIEELENTQHALKL